MKKNIAELKNEVNNHADYILYKRRILEDDWACSLCPPHGGENYYRSRKAKHGNQKPKYKEHRR